MATFTDDFSTDPTARWTHLWNAFTWSSNNAVTGTGGSYSVYATSTGSATQYARVLFKDPSGNGGLILRSTGTGSDGFYVVAVWNDTAYFQRGNDTGYLADMTSTGFTTAQYDYLGVTISGTGTDTTVRLWLNPTNPGPVDATNWDSASDPADATMTASGGTYYDSGTYVGLGVDSTGIVHDDFSGGSFGGDVPRAPGLGAITGAGLAPVVQCAFLATPAVTDLIVDGLVPTRSVGGLPQAVYPISDVVAGSWTASTGSDLYAMVDEPDTPSDTDYIRSAVTPSADTAVLGLGPLAMPDAGTVTLRVRARWVS